MITLKVNEQKLELTDTSYLANRSHNYLKILFDIVENTGWDNRSIYCLVHTSKKTFQFIVTDNQVILPGKVLQDNHFKISLYGVTDDPYTRITTNQIRVKLAPSGYTEEISPVDPISEDIFTYIFEVLDTKVDLEDYNEIIEVINEDINSINTTLNNKSDIGHTHTSDEVSGVDTVAEIEIKKAYNLLSNKIRTYGA